MPLELSHRIHPEYLEVEVNGQRTLGMEFEESISLWSNVFSISKKQDMQNILAHNRAQGKFPVKAQINLSFKIQEIGCTPAHRIAVIAYNGEVTKNSQLIVRFMQSKNYTIQFFKNKEKAKRWLLREKKRSKILDLLDSFD